MANTSGDSLNTCPDCGHKVSRHAEQCPKCGCLFETPRQRQDRAPIPKSGSSGLVIGLVVGGAIGLVGCCGLGILVFALGANRNPFAPRIVGKWQDDANSAHTIEFFSNGALTETTALGLTSKGTYELLNGGRIKMTQGVLGFQVETTWRYSISGLKLTMTSESGFVVAFNWHRM